MNNIMKVLIIDDSQRDIDLFKINLVKEKIDIDESKTLVEGFEKIKNNDYDTIILDLKLAESEGIETVEKTVDFIKKCKKDIPIIIYTTSEENADVIACYSNYANSFVSKSFEIKEIFEKVKNIGEYWLKTSKVIDNK